MNRKIIGAFLTGFLVLTIGACTDARTTAEAPTSASSMSPNSSMSPSASMSPNAMSKSTEPAKTDAQSDTRAKQLEADIRAKEQRGNAMKDSANRNDGDLASEVRSKLEANIPSGNLTVASKEGVVTVSGTVTTPDQLAKIEKLAMEIKGVKSVVSKAAIAPAKTN
jgi:osmotically-inducible protein OsmY